MFSFDLSDELKVKIRKLVKKDKKVAEAINKKIKEIINNDVKSIDRYKNLRYEMKHYKRVRMYSSFVLTFKVDKDNKFILFEDFEHHDKVYSP